MNADPRIFIMQGFAVCARLLVAGRADLLVRLADPAFGVLASQVIYKAFMQAQRDPSLPSLKSAGSELTRVIAEIIRLGDDADRGDRPS